VIFGLTIGDLEAIDSLVVMPYNRTANMIAARQQDWSGTERTEEDVTQHMVKIRLWRTGATKQPSYRVVVTESTSGPSGKFIEVIGHYSPLTEPPIIKIDGEKVKAWVGKGAQVSDTVAHLMKRAGIES
jgi:small subunit ribosomal protein S16